MIDGEVAKEREKNGINVPERINDRYNFVSARRAELFRQYPGFRWDKCQM